MPKFRVRPYEIEAFQMTSKAMNDASLWPEWVKEMFDRDRSAPGSLSLYQKNGDVFVRMVLVTLSGQEQSVTPDDWVIQGARGEFYCRQSEFFEATYERV